VFCTAVLFRHCTSTDAFVLHCCKLLSKYQQTLFKERALALSEDSKSFVTVTAFWVLVHNNTGIKTGSVRINITLRYCCRTMVAMEKQWVLHILNVYL